VFGIPLEESTLKRGAGAGAGAFVAGLVILLVVSVIGGGSVAGSGLLGGLLFVFAILHLWPLLATGLSPWFLLPIGLLAAAGYVVADRSEESGFLPGASVAAGYLPLTVLGYLVVLPLLSSGSVGGNSILIVVFMGVVFPALVGGVGGIAADKL